MPRWTQNCGVRLLPLDFKDQYFGCEIELTGINRATAAQTLADLFGTRSEHSGGGYDAYRVKDLDGKEWKIVRDGSIHPECRRRAVLIGETYKVELNSPKLEYSEMEKLQEVVRSLRRAGGIVNDSCGMHVHVDASKHTPQSLKNVLSIMYSKEDILFAALKVNPARIDSYCQAVDEPILEEIRKLPSGASMDQLKDRWYRGRDGSDYHYHQSRYRVSTKGQVDHDDIPMQKIDCRKFAQKQGWRVVKEVAEKGVSGSKVSASKRDAIQQLKEEAANGEFDILLVYMFDRLGRIESETPFVLEWFVQHGIQMWSTHEGQQKIETHGDKLMNYIRFWQAAGESEKTSIRTRDRIRQIVSSGHYTGGFVCYGYQLVDQGRRNKRDKPVMDLVINEEEATWVRELFYKVIQEGASGYALAEMLNNRGLRTRAGAKFQSSNIIRIIRHEGYTGYIITKNARSEYIPELQIIDQDTFEKANDIISRRSAKTAQDRRIAHTSQNPTLLAGIVYCAHCGAKMSGFMHTDRYKLADGSIREKVQPKYNCFQRGQRNKGGRDCDGQALYLAQRVDAIVLKIVEEVFEKIRDTPYSQVAENRIRQESNLQKTKRAAVEKKIKAAQHALERFEGEILKCLDGTSNFTEDMIAKQIRRYQQELDDAKAEYAELRNARLNEAAEIRKLRTYYDDFRGWAEEFDAAPLEMKRMILSHLIDRVEVGRKYQVTIKLNMEYQQFLDCSLDTDCSAEIGA